MSWAIRMRNWPYYGQLTDWTADGQPDENRSNNCGPESCAMITKYLTGVELPADYIKDVLKGEGTQGYTSVADLSRWFARYCDIETRPVFPWSQSSLTWYVWNALRHGRPLIALRYFAVPGDDTGHFVVPVGIDPQRVYFADPWTGSERSETYAEFEKWSRHELLLIYRQRAIIR